MTSKKIFFVTGGVIVLIALFLYASPEVLAGVVRVKSSQQTALKEVFSPNFLEKKNCLYGGYVRLSVNPQVIVATGNLQPSTQAEMRVRAQTRLYECMPYAMQETELAISTLTGPARARADRLVREAKGWWNASNRFYSKTVIRVVKANRNPRYWIGYPLDDANYAWSYSGNTKARLRKALRDNGMLSTKYVSQQVYDFLAESESTPGFASIKGDMFISAAQTFFPAPLGAVEIALLQDIDRVHREAAEALLCKLKTGGWCPGGRPAPVIAAEYDAKSLDAVRSYGLPPIAPFARGVYAGLTHPELCVISQRIERAHHAWTEGVINGHTADGFTAAWIASLSHSMLHVERRTGEKLVSLKQVTNKNFALSPEITAFTEYPVSGAGSDGSCDLGGAGAMSQ